MALLGGWLSAEAREERAVKHALNELSISKTPVRVEAEGTGISFFTQLSLRKNGLVVARPRTLKTNSVPRDAVMRLTLPNKGRRQVRASVMVPYVKLNFTLKHAMVCALPTAWSGVCQRKADRFNTSRFKNLLLQLPSTRRSFRVLDLSASGLRIFAGTEGNKLMFEEGSEVGPGQLRVGDRVAIALESVVSRAHVGHAVGVEIQLAQEPVAQKMLLNLLNRLSEQEIRRLQIDTV